ncbi:YhgE/Pip domain-containing protein [uncultured Clostridium sp.]|uniref:YhgE/Pip domain-containing protein n=1 Tax=uncultured Clostridium sp. TaxID=59620 RepID=UPI0025EC9F41|nr:YhgE/Pip domain-containing protein [uncultured Clostridium sp.]MDU4883461.1 YhgE/Pip domain-containing protein [Clostridium celatum]MDU7076524.1 YhgE/Pip domain-containing protein [Clostridium celatum]
MKNALLVFKRDVKSIIRNPVAIIIVLGICIIPSLYAWVNIKACWDTYKNTSTIPIAVVNNDKGSVLNDKEINVGNDVVEELKNNNEIGWEFVSEKEADLGLVDGTYYAMIQIPEDFSQDLTSIVSGNIKKPEIIYKVQTKSNPVAVKIAGAAKTSLIDQVTSNFIKTVNETIFSVANDIGEKADENKDKIIKLKDSIILLDENMDLVLSALDGTNNLSININDFLLEIENIVPDLTSGLEAAVNINNETAISADNSRNILNNTIDNLGFNLESIKDTNERIQMQLETLQNSSDNNLVSDIKSTLNDINKTIKTMNESVTSTISFLEKVNSIIQNAEVSNLIASLQNLQSKLESVQDKIQTLQNDISSTSNDLSMTLSSLSESFADINNNIISVIQKYNSNIKEELNNMFNNLIATIDDANYLINQSKGLASEIDEFINIASEGSELTAEMTKKLSESLNEFKEPIDLLSEKLKLVDNNDLINIVSILQSNPSFMGEFISEPFDIVDEAIYEIPNYGSAMAPVYTVLSLWVGGLMLTAILKTEVTDFEGSEKLTLRQKYFGKMITFVVLALIQGLVVSVGNKLILNIYTVNTTLMILFALATSFTFSIIIYTLVAIFGNVGKALSIIFMIVQLAGSGGSYPIQVDPLIFRILQPFFPFTYSLGGFREAIAGPLASSVIIDFVVLGAISILFILFGYYLKAPLHPIVSKFESKFKESGIAEAEE